MNNEVEVNISYDYVLDKIVLTVPALKDGKKVTFLNDKSIKGIGNTVRESLIDLRANLKDYFKNAKKN